ncbi:Mitochondrial inner membrane protease subunit 2 [Anas platyrhynchos]|uniref:Mitochondrial inner membrane protease subunit 2 n=2 Tax=Anatinae TaxID=2068716 RepID=R0K858_ANAPL|nr:Mitochondrial inner membrane protease subunit 2 [Anas platyrhynchos]
MLCSLDHSVAFCPKLASACSCTIVTKTAECAELSSCAARLYKSGMAPVQPAGLYLHLSLTSAGASFCHQLTRGLSLTLRLTQILLIMAQAQGFGRRYIKAFFKGFFVAVPVTVTFLDRVACVARVEGASMQPSLNPGGRQESDVVLLNHWSIRNYDVQRGDIVSLVYFAPWLISVHTGISESYGCVAPQSVAQKGSVHISENTYASVTAYKTESDGNSAETNVMAGLSCFGFIVNVENIKYASI